MSDKINEIKNILCEIIPNPNIEFIPMDTGEFVFKTQQNYEITIEKYYNKKLQKFVGIYVTYFDKNKRKNKIGIKCDPIAYIPGEDIPELLDKRYTDYINNANMKFTNNDKKNTKILNYLRNFQIAKIQSQMTKKK